MQFFPLMKSVATAKTVKSGQEKSSVGAENLFFFKVLSLHNQKSESDVRTDARTALQVNSSPQASCATREDFAVNAEKIVRHNGVQRGLCGMDGMSYFADVYSENILISQFESDSNSDQKKESYDTFKSNKKHMYDVTSDSIVKSNCKEACNSIDDVLKYASLIGCESYNFQFDKNLECLDGNNEHSILEYLSSNNGLINEFSSNLNSILSDKLSNRKNNLLIMDGNRDTDSGNKVVSVHSVNKSKQMVSKEQDESQYVVTNSANVDVFMGGDCRYSGRDDFDGCAIEERSIVASNSLQNHMSNITVTDQLLHTKSNSQVRDVEDGYELSKRSIGKSDIGSDVSVNVGVDDVRQKMFMEKHSALKNEQAEHLVLGLQSDGSLDDEGLFVHDLDDKLFVSQKLLSKNTNNVGNARNDLKASDIVKNEVDQDGHAKSIYERVVKNSNFLNDKDRLVVNENLDDSGIAIGFDGAREEYGIEKQYPGKIANGIPLHIQHASSAVQNASDQGEKLVGRAGMSASTTGVAFSSENSLELGAKDALEQVVHFDDLASGVTVLDDVGPRIYADIAHSGDPNIVASSASTKSGKMPWVAHDVRDDAGVEKLEAIELEDRRGVDASSVLQVRDTHAPQQTSKTLREGDELGSGSVAVSGRRNPAGSEDIREDQEFSALTRDRVDTVAAEVADVDPASSNLVAGSAVPSSGRTHADKGGAVFENRERAEEVFRQVESGAFKDLGQGTKQLILHLDPQDLGQVSVILQVRGKEVRAVLRAGTEETTQALVEQMGQLRQNLENQGFKVTRLEVQTQLADSQTQSQWQGAEQHNQHQENRDLAMAAQRWRTFGRGEGEVVRDVQNVPQREKASQDGVDIFA